MPGTLTCLLFCSAHVCIQACVKDQICCCHGCCVYCSQLTGRQGPDQHRVNSSTSSCSYISVARTSTSPLLQTTAVSACVGASCKPTADSSSGHTDIPRMHGVRTYKDALAAGTLQWHAYPALHFADASSPRSLQTCLCHVSRWCKQ
jgi:hypothetical protein